MRCIRCFTEYDQISLEPTEIAIELDETNSWTFAEILVEVDHNGEKFSLSTTHAELSQSEAQALCNESLWIYQSITLILKSEKIQSRLVK